MLINLSNHPYSQWSVEQIEAALQFGECLDLPFPVVNPEGDSEYIADLAAKYLKKIEKVAVSFDNLTVHLMGEMTFTYALLELLKEHKVRCVASTTLREATELGNGQKESTFRFVQFRDYF